MGETMSYTHEMPNKPDIDSRAVDNSAQLVFALEDMGYDDIEIRALNGALGLFIADTQIAIGTGADAFDASEDLLDRAADLFYHRTPEA